MGTLDATLLATMRSGGSALLVSCIYEEILNPTFFHCLGRWEPSS